MKKQLFDYSARLRELEQMLERITEAEEEQQTLGVHHLIEQERLPALREAYQKMLDALREESGNLEALIEGLDDPGLRQLLRMRYLCGYSWQRCARLTGYAGESGARMRVQRFLAGGRRK